jgi:hypothetical protein
VWRNRTKTGGSGKGRNLFLLRFRVWFWAFILIGGKGAYEKEPYFLKGLGKASEEVRRSELNQREKTKLKLNFPWGLR